MMPISPHLVAAALTVVATAPLFAAAGAALYLVTALACTAPPFRRPKEKWLWLTIAALHVLMAIDAATGLRMALAETGRTFLRSHQWYTQRQEPQIILSALLVIATLALAAVILWRARGPGRAAHGKQAALAGTTLTALILALSLISLHQVDTALQWPASYANLGIALRVTGCLLTLAGAWRSATTAPAAPSVRQ